MTAPSQVTVRVPATSANLGPGFDCLGLALDLWNEVTVRLDGQTTTVQVAGLGAGQVPPDGRNLIARSLVQTYRQAGRTPPLGLEITCQNNVPLGSGLGSSAAAALAGILAANALLDGPFSQMDLLQLAVEMEGHPDNAAAALFGGLTLASSGPGELLVRKVEIAPGLAAAVAVPRFHLPTRTARAALPRHVPLPDAVFNLSRTALVVEALRTGDLELLGQAMTDRLHQPHRLKLIPGAEEALRSARQAGAAAAVISGAGPSLIAFGTGDLSPAAEAMRAAFAEAGLAAAAYCLKVSPHGAQAR